MEDKSSIIINYNSKNTNLFTENNKFDNHCITLNDIKSPDGLQKEQEKNKIRIMLIEQIIKIENFNIDMYYRDFLYYDSTTTFIDLLDESLNYRYKNTDSSINNYLSYENLKNITKCFFILKNDDEVSILVSLNESIKECLDVFESNEVSHVKFIIK
jgi:hypothetical protein